MRVALFVPYTPHMARSVLKVNGIVRKTGLTRGEIKKDGGANRYAIRQRWSEWRDGAKDSPERPIMLSFGLPGVWPGVPKCAHFCFV